MVPRLASALPGTGRARRSRDGPDHGKGRASLAGQPPAGRAAPGDPHRRPGARSGRFVGLMKRSPNRLTTDVLVVGSGIAGLCVALHAARFARVLVVTKREGHESNTNY